MDARTFAGIGSIGGVELPSDTQTIDNVQVGSIGPFSARVNWTTDEPAPGDVVVTLTGFEVLVFAWVSLALGLIDLDFQILPNSMTYPSILFGLLFSWFGGYTWWLDSLIGALVGAALPIAVIVIYKLWRGVEGMGWGDVKYLAAIGSVVGLRGCVGVLVVASILGALVGVGLILSGRGSGKTALPFGTFLALAVILWLYAPPSWIAWSPL